MAFDSEQGRVLVYDNGDGELYAFDPATGTATLATTVSARPNSGAWRMTDVRRVPSGQLVDDAVRQSQPPERSPASSRSPSPWPSILWNASARLPMASAGGCPDSDRYALTRQPPVLGDIQGAVFVDVWRQCPRRRRGRPGGRHRICRPEQQRPMGSDEPVQTTDANGEYLFADFRPGHYVVREILPEGYQQSPSQFSSDAYYGSAYNGSGQTQMVVIDPATGNAHTLGGLMGTALDGLVVTHDGSIYGMNGADSSLYAVDPTTGLATKIGPSGFELGYGLPTIGQRPTTSAGPVRSGHATDGLRRTTGAATRSARESGA